MVYLWCLHEEKQICEPQYFAEAFYYPTALRRIQVTPKTSTNITGIYTPEDRLRYWQTRAHCCRHKCFPVCPRSQHLLRTQILCPGHKNVFDFVQKHFVSLTNVSQSARARKRHEQQCFRNNVSSFATAFRLGLFAVDQSVIWISRANFVPLRILLSRIPGK